MLSFISWSQFLISFAWLVVIYYFIVAFLYYRTEILTLFQPRTVRQTVSEQKDDSPEHPVPNPVIIGQAHELTADLKNLFATAVKAKTIKEELVMALQMLLRDYPDLKDLPIAAEINQYIKTDCQNICSITLSDAEMRMLWNG